MSTSINVHEVEELSVSKIKNLGMIYDRLSYFRTITVKTVAGELIDLTVFSPDPDALTVREEH